MFNKEKLLDRTECLTLLTTKASSHWSYWKFILGIPLILTSSSMVIINSITTDGNEVKIPNIIVNSISVLIMSLTNSIKASEKLDLFHRLSQQFMMLSCELEQIEEDVSIEEAKTLLLKYEQLVNQVCFEEIPQSIKISVSKLYTDNQKFIPIQLNGTSAIFHKNNRNSGNSIKLSGDIV